MILSRYGCLAILPSGSKINVLLSTVKGTESIGRQGGPWPSKYTQIVPEQVVSLPVLIVIVSGSITSLNVIVMLSD